MCNRLRTLRKGRYAPATSRFFGIGESVTLKKVNQLEQYAEFFFDPESSKGNIASAGEKSIVAIYSGENGDNLDKLRYQKYCEKVVKRCCLCRSKNTTTYIKCSKVSILSWLGNVRECYA